MAVIVYAFCINIIILPIKCIFENSEDPDKKPADLDLHCLQNSIYLSSEGTEGLTLGIKETSKRILL